MRGEVAAEMVMQTHLALAAAEAVGVECVLANLDDAASSRLAARFARRQDAFL